MATRVDLYPWGTRSYKKCWWVAHQIRLWFTQLSCGSITPQRHRFPYAPLCTMWPCAYHWSAKHSSHKPLHSWTMYDFYKSLPPASAVEVIELDLSVRVSCVCPSVRALTGKPLKFRTQNFVWGCSWTISRRSSKVNVIGQRSRSPV